MKRLTLFSIIAAALLTSLNSCSPYKNSATTPDDVYYSPAKGVEVTSVPNGDNSEYYSTRNDNYVKMRVQNPDKWSYFDDYNTDYYASNYGYGVTSGISVGLAMGMGYGMGYSPWYGGFGYYSPMSYYNSYYAWNNFYNPYYGCVVVVNGKNTMTPSYSRISNFNPSAYKGNYYNSRPNNYLNNTNTSRSSRTYYNTNQNSNFNRSTDGRPSYNNMNTMPMRSSPSNFGGGSSGGGGGAMRGGGMSRPGR